MVGECSTPAAGSAEAGDLETGLGPRPWGIGEGGWPSDPLVFQAALPGGWHQRSLSACLRAPPTTPRQSNKRELSPSGPEEGEGSGCPVTWQEMVLFCLGQFGPRRSVLAAGLHCESVWRGVVQGQLEDGEPCTGLFW